MKGTGSCMPIKNILADLGASYEGVFLDVAAFNGNRSIMKSVSGHSGESR